MLRRGLVSLVVCLLFVFVSTSDCFSSTAGNPSTLNVPGGDGVFSLKKDSKKTIKVGVDLSFNFARDLDGEYSNSKLGSGKWYMAKASYRATERIEPYVLLGIANLRAQWEQSSQVIYLESSTGFGWGAGTKVFIHEFPKSGVKLLGDASFKMADLGVHVGKVSDAAIALDATSSDFLIREWQVAFIVAHEMEVASGEVWGVYGMVPYVGLKYSDVSGRLKQTNSAGVTRNLGNLSSSRKVGVFAGCDFLGAENVLLNIEGRFMDEEAMTLGMLVLF